MASPFLPPPRRLGRSSSGQPRFNAFRRKTYRLDVSQTEDYTDGAEVDDCTDGEEVGDYTDGVKVENYTDGAKDEPDCGPPVKKPKVEDQSGRQSQVKTYNDKPLKSFSVFIPPKLPASILNSSSALQEFVRLTWINHLSVFQLNGDVQILDARFPFVFQDRLGANLNFIRKLLMAIFHKIWYVQSIKTFYAPKIIAPSLAHVANILDVFKDKHISHLYLSLEITKIKFGANELKNITDSIKMFKIEKLTIVSDASEIKELCKKMAEYLQESTVKVNCTNKTPRDPGPKYLMGEEPEDEEEARENVRPLSLARSINACNGSQTLKQKTMETPRVVKKKARTACSTDCTYYCEADLAAQGIFTSEIWNLQTLHKNGIDGTDTTIAILDSGINYIHPAFKNKILVAKNFVLDEADNMDCVIDSDGHGSLCAGIAAGSSFHCPTSEFPDSRCMKVPPGVAPGAKLIMCKVLKTSDGTVDSGAFLRALKWLKQMHASRRYHIDVISISLSSTLYHHPRASVISELTAAGIIVVCCASNEGRLLRQPISFPGRLGHVLCVGAHDENGKPTSFCPVGREMDFLCPGENIWGPGCGTEGPFAMDCANGTSCATPGLAGLVCLVLNTVAKMCRKDPDKFTIGGKSLLEHVHNVWVMRELLKEMSSSPGHHSDEIGYGSLDPQRLLLRSNEEIMRVINNLIEDE